MQRDRRLALFVEYGAYHRNAINRATHVFGFPLIFLSSFALLDRTGVPYLGAVVFAFFTIANFAVEWRLAFIATLVTTGLYFLGDTLATAWLCGLLGVGVAVPVIGHVAFERRWPDTMARFGRFELVGHLWFLDRVFRFVDDFRGSENRPDRR